MVTMQHQYPAQANAVPLARHDAARCARELGARESVANAVALATTEACSNVVLHAYRGRDEPGEMTLSVEKLDGRLFISVADSGLGMSPRLDSPGLGMGLPLISRLTERFDVSSRPDAGTEIRMSFELDAC